MISLSSILKEEFDPKSIADPYFSEFSKNFKFKSLFKYIGLKNKEYIFTAPVTDIGFLNMIISDAVVMARITEKYAYFGIIYTLNGLEQFDATVCKMDKPKNQITIKLFDDSDSDFSNSNTNFIKIFKVMV